MTEGAPDIRPWGRFVSLLLAALALFAGQVVALAALTLWYGRGLSQLPNLGGEIGRASCRERVSFLV